MKYFTHLHLHTSYSLNSGTIKIDDLINIAKKKNIFLIEDWETLDDHSKYAAWRAETGLADIMEPLLDGGSKALKMIRCGSSLEI